jgi:hypothetical protein
VPTLKLTNEQVIDLIQQLPSSAQDVVLRGLVGRRWPSWTALSDMAQERAREVARERGHDWGKLSEDERETLIDQIVHEDRL